MFFKMTNSCDGIYDSLDVRFTKKCDNNCPFCIEKEGIDLLGATDVNKLIASVKSSGIKSVLILGGEPFLFPKLLLEFITKIRSCVDTIYITTSLPKTFITKSELVYLIMQRVDGLNVSVQSTDDTENNLLFRASSKHSRMGILRQLNRKYSHKIRTSINLVKGGIDSSNKLEKSLDDLSNIGCQHIKINELQHSPELYVSYEEITQCKMEQPFSNGCSTYIEDYKGMKILLKRSCFLTQDSLNADYKDFMKIIYKKYFHKYKNKFKVLYENGTITNKWLKKGESYADQNM